MDIKQVDGFETQVPARALNLIFEICGRHTVHPAGQFVGIEDSRLDVLAMEVGARVRWRIAVKGKIAGLGADQNFVAMQVAGSDQCASTAPILRSER